VVISKSSAILFFKMSTFNCSKRELIVSYIEGGKTIAALSTYLTEKQVSEDNICFIIDNIKRVIIPNFNKRWKDARRNMDHFLRSNINWLDSEYSVTIPRLENVSSDSTPSTSSGKRGRPCVSYGDSSESSKKRKNTILLNEYGLEHILNAYLQGLRSIGEGTEAILVEELRLADAEKKVFVMNLFDNANKIKGLTDQEALSVFIDLELTKAQYLYLRNVTDERNCPLFPPYYKIQEMKKRCYPPASSIEITNTYAKILKVQDLLDHTAARILSIDAVYQNGQKHLLLYSKWGCDGSSGQSQYKQKLPEESEFISDANLFITSFVPIRLIDEESGAIIWQNPVPSSVRFCRPISIEFSKETPEKTKSVVDEIKNQIQTLLPSIINKEGVGVQVRHELFLTMIDGKVAQVLTDTPSGSTCTICGATPRQMNDLTKVTARPENENAYQYGLSTLHAWIRCMEMILHISYNLSFQTWSATSEEKKRLKQEKKTQVQKRFREELGLNIDKPRQGTGNSNDGNTARRFFYNASCSADITGVDIDLIKRLYIILQALSSGVMIDDKKFGDYALETARIYVSKYSWYYMPSSVHKILIHGESIISHFAVLPIGQLSEDAQESRNKDYKKFRLHHARKCSRIATNQDVFHTLLYTSDPYITSIRKPYEKNVKELDEDALHLLKVNQLISDPEVHQV
jgi:hypothetical protein